MSDLQTPAPAQAAPVSAGFDAASKGDFSAFQSASDAARVGKPLADVAASTETPAPADTPAQAEARTVSKRQQETNERIREAVERATADTRAELARLRADLTPKPAPAQPAEPTVAEWKRIHALPDAPKLAQFDTVEEHAAAMAYFVHKTLSTESTAADRQRADHERTTAQTQRIDTFVKQLHETRAADPTFVSKLTPEMRALKPFGGLAPGETGGPRNVVAEQVYDSPIAPQVLLHFSQHPEALAAIEAMPAEIAALPPRLRARAHIQHIVLEYGKLEGSLVSAARPAAPSTITNAPPPPPSVSSRAGSSADPSAAAVAKGDFGAFQRQEDAKRRERFAR